MYGATYQRQLAAAQCQEAKAEQGRILANEFLRIINLHRVEFTPATPPVAPQPMPPDQAAILRHYEQQTLAGVSVFNRRARKEARQRARAWADGEAQRQWAEASQHRIEVQAYLDQRWRQLCDNAPDVVIETLDEAFEDNEAPSAAVGVEGGEVALVVLVPDIDLAVPDRMPTTTPAGNLSLKKITQREREDYYKLFVCGQVLVTLREAFAVAPGIQAARVAVLRDDGSDAHGQPKMSCVLATKLERAALDRVQWASADAAQIVNEVSTDLVLNQRGRSHGLTPIDLAGEPELARLIQSIDLTELSPEDLDEASNTAGLPNQSPGDASGAAGANAAVRPEPRSAAIPPAGHPTVDQLQGGSAARPRRPGGLSRKTVMALLVGIGSLVVLCCGIGVVMAAIGGGTNNGPVRPAATSSPATTTVPKTSEPANTSPGSTSTTTTTTAPVRPAPVPPTTTEQAPPPQTGVHPGAFCSPHWAYGYTSNGVLMQCKPSATDSAFRWRQA